MKEELRRNYVKMRNDLAQRTQKSSRIEQFLLGLDEVQKAKFICVYVNAGSEVETEELIKNMLRITQVAVPVVRDEEIMMAKITSMDQLNKKNKFGILEPSEPDFVTKFETDTIIVPGIAFDTEGHRIGYGQGYYDRLLKGYWGTSIGLTFDDLFVDSIPKDDWDQPVDIIVTEKKVYKLM